MGGPNEWVGVCAIAQDAPLNKPGVGETRLSQEPQAAVILAVAYYLTTPTGSMRY